MGQTENPAIKADDGGFWIKGVSIAVIVLSLALLSFPNKNEANARAALGLQCLSSEDGSLPALARRVKPMLLDPDSFVHVTTTTSGLLANGTHRATMKFRAKNGSAITEGSATAVYKADDCTLVSWRML